MNSDPQHTISHKAKRQIPVALERNPKKKKKRCELSVTENTFDHCVRNMHAYVACVYTK